MQNGLEFGCGLEVLDLSFEETEQLKYESVFSSIIGVNTRGSLTLCCIHYNKTKSYIHILQIFLLG